MCTWENYGMILRSENKAQRMIRADTFLYFLDKETIKL